VLRRLLKRLVPLEWQVRFHSSKTVPKDIVVRAWNRLRGAIPIPPGEFIYLVLGHRCAARFLRRGRTISKTIRAVLAKNGVEIERLNAILDFGCGVGRIMRHWESLQHPVLHGTDYNPRLVAWCQENLKFAKFQVNSLTGNLPYESEKFDFIYAFSVFTHLSEPLQFFWISELSRLLKPGGHLFFTTQGDHFLSQLSVAEQAKFRNGQLVVQGAENAGSNLCTTYHPPAYVQESMAQEFSVVDFIPGGAKSDLAQDVYLMKKLKADP
jgi:SAM-dependent methyltransferase